MGHGESLRLMDLLGWTIPTASRTGLDHGRRFGGSISGAGSNDATTAFAGDADSLFDQLLHKRRSSDTCAKRKATPARMFYPAQYTTIPVPCMFTVLSKATNPLPDPAFPKT